MLYKAKHIITVVGNDIKDGEVLVRNGIIADVGFGLQERYPNEQLNDLGDCALMPGFVNAHSHIELTHRRNFADALNFSDWLDKLGFKKGALTDSQVLLAAAHLGALECLKSGITCIADCSFSGASAFAMAGAGMRGVSYLELFGQSMGNEYIEKFRLKEHEVRSIQSQLPERVKVGISPHSIYTSSDDVLRLCAETYAKHNIPVSVHVAETEAEKEYILFGTGPIANMRRKMGYEPMVRGVSPLRCIFDAELLREGVLLVHCVHLSDEDIKLIYESNASIATCARSNAFLGAGIAPLNKLINANVKIGIGTDSVASCFRIDFFEEMRFILGLHRAIAKDAAALKAKDILRMATFGGAEALGLSDRIGSIEIGKAADLIAIDISRAMPNEDIYLTILSCSPKDIRMVMVDGKEIARNGNPLLVEEAECEDALRAAIRSAGID